MEEVARTPCSDPPVRRGVRAFAWIFAACDTAAIILAVYFAAVDGKVPHGGFPWERAHSRSATLMGPPMTGIELIAGCMSRPSVRSVH